MKCNAHTWRKSSIHVTENLLQKKVSKAYQNIFFNVKNSDRLMITGRTEHELQSAIH
jgi:hypothetical protein